MIELKQSTAFPTQIFAFDASGDPVLGITDGQWTKRIAKGGGAFAVMTVTITETGNGWYSLTYSASHTDTLGSLSMYFIAPGTQQVNVQYRVVTKLSEDLDVATFPSGANQPTYTITNVQTGLPLEGVTVWISTDPDANNVIWVGHTDAFGVARDINGNRPMLDAGTYYFWHQKSAFLFSDPDSHFVDPTHLIFGDTGQPIGSGFVGTGIPSTRGRVIPYLCLEDYARFVAMAESTLYGIVRQTDAEIGCSNSYWDETDRYIMTQAIRQAETRLARHLGYPLKLTYVCDERYRYDGRCTINLRKNKVVSLGKKIEEVSQLAVPTGVETLAEEYVLTFLVDFDDCKELVVYYPDQTRWEIKPSKVVISAGVAEVTIPRPRLLAPEFLIDYREDSDRPQFDDPAFFLHTVDIYHRFPDSAQAVTYVWNRKACGCRSSVTCIHGAVEPGTVFTQNGTGVVVDARLGIIQIEPASLNTETGLMVAERWGQCYAPDSVLINYVTGINEDCDENCPEETDPDLDRAIIALAHSTLPRPICSCDPIKFLYEMDVAVVAPATGPIPRTPFGSTVGQALAWDIMKDHAVGFGGLLNG